MQNDVNIYGTNWKNLNFDSSDQFLNLLEPYNFETLFLELSCNFKDEDLTAENIKKHALQIIQNKLIEAKEVLNDNINNILNHARKERE